jgi:hypothetical protein
MTDSTDWAPNFGGISLPPPNWAAKRPIRIALLGDFSSGALAGRLESGAALAKRKPLPVEFDSLEDALARMKLKLQLPLGADGAPIEIEVSEIESFHPDELYRNLEIFSALASLRKRLNTPSTFAKAAAEVQSWGKGAGKRASSVNRRARARGASPSSGGTLDDFARLTGRPAVTRAPTTRSTRCCAAWSGPSSSRPPARTRMRWSPPSTRRSATRCGPCCTSPTSRMPSRSGAVSISCCGVSKPATSSRCT